MRWTFSRKKRKARKELERAWRFSTARSTRWGDAVLSTILRNEVFDPGHLWVGLHEADGGVFCVKPVERSEGSWDICEGVARNSECITFPEYIGSDPVYLTHFSLSVDYECKDRLKFDRLFPPVELNAHSQPQFPAGSLEITEM